MDIVKWVFLFMVKILEKLWLLFVILSIFLFMFRELFFVIVFVDFFLLFSIRFLLWMFSIEFVVVSSLFIVWGYLFIFSFVSRDKYKYLVWLRVLGVVRINMLDLIFVFFV